MKIKVNQSSEKSINLKIFFVNRNQRWSCSWYWSLTLSNWSSSFKSSKYFRVYCCV